ncbi:MAG: DNA polymerase III subunit alpha [Planctomycetes bacterium]|nr:DNA polymerase III subunit alpha [Planctomycetota bacterium]
MPNAPRSAMYAPLRVHGHHSMLTGVDSPAALVARARELGFEALALCDVDTIAGVVEFLNAVRAANEDGARAAPLRAIVGAELSDPSGTPGRVVALVENETGWRNLCKLVSARHLGDDPGRPGARLDGPGHFRLADQVVRHREGLIFLVDHPRLLVQLTGRVDARSLFAAIAPAALARKTARVSAPLPRNAALEARSTRTIAAPNRGDENDGLGTRGPDARESDARRAADAADAADAARDDDARCAAAEAAQRENAAPRGTSAPPGASPAEPHYPSSRRDEHGELVALAPRRAPRDAEEPDDALRAERAASARFGIQAERASDDELDPPKTPPPARAVPVEELLLAARAAGVATLAVPDVYCARAEGLADHRVRVAIKHNALVHDLPDAWIAETPAHLLASDEMAALYAGLRDVPGPFERAGDGVIGALERTLAVAERCTFTPRLGGILFPKIELARGATAYSELAGFAFDGARARYEPLKPEVVRRLDYELATIDQLGFAPYFLLVKQIADFARERGIPCVGRGSAADSLVAYCLRLTDADPLRYRLTFERFLNPSRKDRPDIDLDFCWRRRDEVLTHVYELFGLERTAMISTLNRCGVRAAFREAALALGLPPAEVNGWSRRLPYYFAAPEDGDETDAREAELGLALPPKFDAQSAERAAAARAALPPKLRANPLARLFAESPEAAGFPFDDARWTRALELAARLVDTPRHYGLHPGGVVVAPNAITDVVACQRAKKGVIVTQLDKDAVEAIGLVKMDLLGNRVLTTLDDCLAMLRARGVEPDLEALAEDDPATQATLRAGRTIGCFQVESPGMRNLLQQIGARTMDDVIQSVALIRPGPAGSGMKDAYVRRFNQLEEPTPPHPRLTDVLWETRGVMLYQEDVMQAAARVAGMDLAEADLLRRALQKRRAHELGPLCERFLAGAAEQGIERTDALSVWDLIANFASFGFCKAHAVTYGRIAYRAVWLKTHHPAEYLASFLASETGYYDARVYVEEARRLGVAILGPDVNKSGATFTVEYELGRGAHTHDSAEHRVPASGSRTQAGALAAGLRVGLRQVKGLSERTLDAVLAARAEHGAFVSLPDFLERTGAHTDECERLIQVGAFDAFDRTRPELLWRLHLLRAPERKLPRGAAAEEHGRLDPAQLAAARATPKKREKGALDAARAKSAGWRGKGLGLSNAPLARGESAPMFAEPEAPPLALPRLPDVAPRTRAIVEFELLGLTLDAHPVELFPCAADERIPAAPRTRDGRPSHPVNPLPCGDLAAWQGARVTLRGWLAASRHVRTSDQRSMRFLTLEDETGLAEVVVFPDVYEFDGAHLAGGGVLCVTGRVENQMGACTLHAERIW